MKARKDPKMKLFSIISIIFILIYAGFIFGKSYGCHGGVYVSINSEKLDDYHKERLLIQWSELIKRCESE